MTAVTDAIDIETWRSAVIQQILDGCIEDQEDWARVGMALQDVRVRDVIAWHSVNGYASEMYRIAMTAASNLPERERANALCIGAICSAVLGNDQLAMACANFALMADSGNNLARLLVIAGRQFNLTTVVDEVFGVLRLEECRHGTK